MNRTARIACSVAVTLCGLCGQSLPSFEVATVRPVDRTGQPGHGTFAVSGSRISFTGYTLRALILYAYDMRNYQISGGPGWIASDTYTIVAREPKATQLRRQPRFEKCSRAYSRNASESNCIARRKKPACSF